MDKEKSIKDIVIRIKPSLHAKLLKKCMDNYKTISEVIRDFIVSFVKDEKTTHSASAMIKTEISCDAKSEKAGRIVSATCTLKPMGGFFKIAGE